MGGVGWGGSGSDGEGGRVVPRVLSIPLNSSASIGLKKVPTQHAKKVVSDSPGLVNFAIGPVNSVPNLPDGQVVFLGVNSNYRRTVINPGHQIFSG